MYNQDEDVIKCTIKYIVHTHTHVRAHTQISYIFRLHATTDRNCNCSV